MKPRWLGSRAPVLLITDRRQTRGSLIEVVHAALRGGCRALSLREKDLPAAEQIRLAAELHRLAADLDAWVMLHGPAGLAQAAGLMAVHLATHDDVSAARRLMGAKSWISISTHSLEAAVRAQEMGADAVTLSPVFESRSKPGYGPPLGLDNLAGAAKKLSIPVIALGGINPHNARSCLDAGASAIAVMGDIMRADDPSTAMAAIIKALALSESRPI